MTDMARTAACERARTWASLLPDGELSLFERRLLDVHCVRCDSCRRLRDDIGSFTAIVRATPAEEMSRPVRVARPRIRALRSATGAFASGGVAVLAFALAVWIGPQVRNTHVTTRYVGAPVIIVTPEQGNRENQAIWTFKRARSIEQDVGAAHRTGLILS
jgi:hypothetical protein